MKLKMTAAMLLAAVSTQAHSAVIISEYIEGSSFNKAIELYNNGDTTVDLSTYELKYYFNGNTTANTSITLEGEIAPMQTFVIAENDAVAGILDNAQQTNINSWFNGDDAVVLYNGEVVVDSIGQIGVDPGSYWSEGDVRTQNQTIRRLDSIISGDTDPFDAYSPIEFETFAQDTFDGLGSHLGQVGDNPDDDDQGDNDDQELDPVLVCGEGTTAISLVQGDGVETPLSGQEVIIEGVVTSDLQADDELKGYYIQSVTPDDNALTSEALFVYDTTFDVSDGDLVQVRGTAGEYYDGTQISSVSDVLVCGTAEVVATPISFPVTDEAELEALEHMLVAIEQPMFVTETYSLGRYGQFSIASERLYQGTEVAAPGDEANAVEASNVLKSIVVDDGSTVQNSDYVPYPAPELSGDNTLRLGDSLEYVQGILTYSYSAYRIHPTESVEIISTNPRTESPETVDLGNLKVASFNVLNYFNGDGQGEGFPTSRGADSVSEFERQRVKTIAALTQIDADVIGLMEMENDGFDEYSALQDLVNGLIEATGINYQMVAFDVDQIGTDAITNAIIYNAENVTLAGTPVFSVAAPFDYSNRPPVVASFTENETGEAFTFVVNHFKSKGSCSSATDLDQDQGDGQSCWNATRVAAVNALDTWLKTSPTGVEDDDVIILGDMNAYSKEDPITQFTNLGYVNTFSDEAAYSYVYSGRLGSLDHAFVNAELAKQLVNATHWHINADEPYTTDYNVEYKSDYQQANLYRAGPYRSSDHDPIILEFKLNKVTEQVYSSLKSRSFRGKYLRLRIPENTTRLEVTLEGGDGDATLKVGSRGKRHHRSGKSQRCISANEGNDESCIIENPRAGAWFIGLKGRYSDATLTYRIVE